MIMNENTAVALINIAIMAMIAACTITIAVVLHSPAGLWSLLALLFMVASSDGACPNKTGEGQ